MTQFKRMVPLCIAVFAGMITGAESGWELEGESLNVNQYMNASYPDISYGNGKIYVAWNEISGGHEQVYVKRYNGSGWQQIGAGLNINPARNAYEACLAFKDQTPYVTWWEGDTGSPYQIYAKYYNGNGWEQTGGSLNVNPAENAYAPRIAIESVDSYVTWYESDGNANQIYIKKYNGVVWEQIPGSINIDVNQDAYEPDLCLNNGTPYVVWRETTWSNISKIYVKHFNGQAWEQDGNELNPGSSYGYRPRMCMYAGTPFITWYETNGGVPQIVVKYLNGGQWEQAGESLNVAVGQAAHGPTIDVQNGTPYVSWFEDNGDKEQVYVKTFDLDEWKWDGASLNVDTDQAGYYPSIIHPEDKPYVAWHERDHNQINQIYVKYYLTPTPTSTQTPTSTITQTSTSTPTYTATPTITLTSTVTPTSSITFTATPTPTSTVTPTITLTGTGTPTSTVSTTPTLTLTTTAASTISSTPTTAYSATRTITPTRTPSLTVTESPVSTLTATSTPIASETATPPATGTATPISTLDATPTWANTATSTPSASPVTTVTHTPTHTGTVTFTKSPTQVATGSPTGSTTPTPAATCTGTETRLPTPITTSTFTTTLTPSITETETPGFSTTFTPAVIPSLTATPTADTSGPVAVPSFTSTIYIDLRIKREEIIAYPNPARGYAWFVWEATQVDSVHIEIYSMSGEQIARITQQNPGQRTIWNTAGIAPGIYLYRTVISTNGKEKRFPIRKIAIIK